jgi:hypothetical protein
LGFDTFQTNLLAIPYTVGHSKQSHPDQQRAEILTVASHHHARHHVPR